MFILVTLEKFLKMIPYRLFSDSPERELASSSTWSASFAVDEVSSSSVTLALLISDLISQDSTSSLCELESRTSVMSD